MVEIQNQIEKLIKQCGLGSVQKTIQPLTGGFMHKIFAVETTTGKYAVKFLNPQIMKRPTAKSNYERAEKYEKILADNNIPIVSALILNGKKMQVVDGNYFYLFPWQEGSITDWKNITSEQCKIAGELQARIHNIDLQKNIQFNNNNTGSDTHSFKKHIINWEKYVDLSINSSPEIAEELKENLPLLEKITRELNEAECNLPNINCICDEDMDPKNVMWHNGKAFIIDLECLDRGNPISHAMQLSLQWSGITTCELIEENLKSFWNGYLSMVKIQPVKPNEIFGIAFTWVEWLEYNIKRALKIECNDVAEQKMGIEQTIMTINRIKYINQNRDIIIHIIKEAIK